MTYGTIFNALTISRDHLALANESIPFGSATWIAYAGICCFLVLFAGVMSGLTLGLMSLSLVDLEILERSGSPSQKKQAGSYLIPMKHGHFSD